MVTLEVKLIKDGVIMASVNQCATANDLARTLHSVYHNLLKELTLTTMEITNADAVFDEMKMWTPDEPKPNP